MGDGANKSKEVRFDIVDTLLPLYDESREEGKLLNEYGCIT